MRLETLEDWANYVSTLSGLKLRSKGIAANSIEFVQILQDEGATSAYIADILMLFALAFKRDNQAPPETPGQYLSYSDLLSLTGR